MRRPSEALRIRRAFRNDELDGFTPMGDQYLLSMRGSAPNFRLVLRLRARENLATGRITSRPCFCISCAPMSKKLCAAQASPPPPPPSLPEE